MNSYKGAVEELPKGSRIVFFLARYSGSGVPLAQLRLAKALALRGYAVDFYIGFAGAEFKAPDVAGLSCFDMNKQRVASLLPAISQVFRKVQPLVVFSAEDHLNFIVLLAAVLTMSKAKISVSSRVTPFDTYCRDRKGALLRKLMPLVTFRATALVCVSKDMVGQYAQIFGRTRHQFAYNVVVDSYAAEKMSEPVHDSWFQNNDVPIVVSAGRLASEKGFADLINAFALVRGKLDARLAILGDGPLFGELEALIDNLGLSSSVRLFGFQSNPLRYFSKSDVYVLSSYVEGMPNVLVEAMMCGCTPVANNCPTGPRELLEGKSFGFLVPPKNVAAMADAIIAAISSPACEEKLQAAVAPFVESVVVDRHLATLGFRCA